MISFSKIYHIMGLSCFRAISEWDGSGSGLDLCAGLFYEHRFAMLINLSPHCIVFLAHNVLIFSVAVTFRGGGCVWWALHHHVVGAPHSSLTHTTPHCYIQASLYGLFLIHEKFLSFFWVSKTTQIPSVFCLGRKRQEM